MKKTAFLLFATALACAVAAMTTGCRSTNRGFNPPSITATLSATNHIGAAIQGGNQISAMMDKDAVLAVYKDVAMQAAKSGTEMSLTSVGHGASKQPNVQRESKATEKLTNSLANAIKAAKSGGNDPQALAKFGADLVGGLVELSEEAANPPAADDASLLGFDLKVGPGANLAGIAVAESLSRTRIESVKASRSTYSRVQTTDTQESNTPAGIKEITGAMVELQKLNSPAGVVAGSQKPGLPEAATPAPVPPPGDATGEPTDMTPAERVELWYPSANHTDKPGFPASETALWKPISDSNGKLAIHLPHSALGKVIKVTVDDEASNVGQTGNGWRPLLRFSKPGGSYSGTVTVLSETGTWTAKNPNPAQRANLEFKKATPASELPPAVTPAEPTSEGEDAAAPGEQQAP